MELHAKASPLLAVVTSLLLGVCFGLLCVVPVRAASTCPPLPQVSAQPSPAEWVRLRDQLAPLLPKCLGSAQYFSLYGASLMHTGDLSRALEMLERALLLSPDNGGALLDYSYALYYSGELLAALDINRQLQRRSDTPEHIRKLLDQRQAVWESNKTRWTRQFALLSGYHDNLNGVADLSSLTLTLDEVNLSVLLDDSSRAVAGGYLSSRFSLQRINQVSAGYQRFSLILQNYVTELSDVNTDEVALSYEDLRLLSNGSRRWRVDASYLRNGDEDLYWSLSGQMFRYWDWNGCSPYVEASGQQLEFMDRGYLDEFSVKLGGGVRCGGNKNQLTVGAFANYNQALHGRPGADRSGGGVSVKWQRDLVKGMLFTQVSLTSLHDDEGYSPLLESFERRTTDNVSLSLQYLYPVGHGITLHAGLYVRHQDSNIELFDIQSTNMDVGFSVNF